MDKAQEIKFIALIEGVATATGQPFFYAEILALLKESSELSQKLSQIYNVQDEALRSIGEEYSIRDVEVALRTNEAKLRKEIKEIVDDLTSTKNVAKMQQRRMEKRIKAEEPTVGNIQRIIAEKTGVSILPNPDELTTGFDELIAGYEFTPEQLAKIDELTKLPPDELIKEVDEVLATTNTHLNEVDDGCGYRALNLAAVDHNEAVRRKDEVPFVNTGKEDTP